MEKLNYKDFIIEIQNEPTFSLNSTDNVFSYHHTYCAPGSNRKNLTSKHGIILKNKEEIISSSILCGIGGATGVHKTGVLIYKDNLLICVSNNVFCLGLPNLNLNWIVQADEITCFQIFTFQNGFIIHGELGISSIDIFGNVNWTFNGSDIFVTPSGENEIELTEEYINLIDWEGRKYRIDYNGKHIL